MQALGKENMKYTEALAESIKGSFLIDLFETYDVDVIYKYDRTYEGIEDEYSAEIPEMGLEFMFNKDQKLTTLFMKKVLHTGHNPFSEPDPRLVPFNTYKKAQEYAQNKSIKVVSNESKYDSFFKGYHAWVKFIYDTHSIHYEFNESGLKMVTLQLENA